MTGGMAFIYDEDGELPAQVNDESVIFQRIEVPHYEALLKGLIEEHARETQSQFAERLLNDWHLVPRPLLAGRAEGDGPPARRSGPRGTGGGVRSADKRRRAGRPDAASEVKLPPDGIVAVR